MLAALARPRHGERDSSDIDSGDVDMGKRVCSECGEDKDIKGGKICEKGHFLCKACASKGWSPRKNCPVCNTKLT